MTAGARSRRRALIFLAVLVALSLGGAHGLDAFGLTESLLSSDPARFLVAAVFGPLFFVSRLLLVFIAPGLVIAALLLSLRGERRESPAPKR